MHVLPSHCGDDGRDVHHILPGSLLKSHVNGNQYACRPHTSTAGRDSEPLIAVTKSYHQHGYIMHLKIY